MKGAKTYLLILAVAVCPLIAIAAVALGVTLDKMLLWTGLAALGMAHAVQDFSTDVYDSASALPNGAATTYSSTFDLGSGENIVRPPNVEIVVGAPALGATPLPNGKYMYYDLYHDTDSTMATEELLLRIGQQLGAGGVGDDAATLRTRLPSTCNRYIRVKATGTDAGDASGSNFSAQIMF